ncbi:MULTISPECIES: DUF1236 domain-containing protein [Rhizobium]|uniref:DUF1236 domain-containing protein n=2 Tax=Rhizobium metallidurans TaxID=1265931 RepID=A0A7W6CQ57_9HYPH|nr:MULTISPECIES: DUF1236 domain-containing protein [Rhizobium]MBB3962992.1 hypothetical protein [Rhizobium metallidurans]
MKRIILAAAMTCMAASAYADGAVTGAVGGAATGAIVGGPIGAGVGAVVGGVAGGVIDPPPAKVVTYVEQAPMPAQPVVVQERVKVGVALPPDVVVTPVPEDPNYGYVIVGQQRVIVEPQTRKVVQVIQ